MALTAPNSEVSTQLDNRTDANPDGTVFGQSASDKINFYGRIPTAQRVVSNVSLLTATTATSTGVLWGAYSTSVSGTASTYYQSSYATSASLATTAQALLITEIANTLVGLGLWKVASV